MCQFSDACHEERRREGYSRGELIAPELLHRFNGDILLIDYPSPAETAALIESTGLAVLADEMGVRIKPDDIDWTRGGIRALESIATRLSISQFRRLRAKREKQLKLPSPEGSPF